MFEKFKTSARKRIQWINLHKLKISYDTLPFWLNKNNYNIRYKSSDPYGTVHIKKDSLWLIKRLNVFI